MKKEKDRKNKDKVTVPLGKILGYGFLFAGILSILNFFGPVPIPTIGLSAIISGIILTGAGLVLLIPNKKVLYRKYRELLSKKTESGPPGDPLLPVRIIKLAEEHRGILTVSITAIKLNVPLEKAEKGLEECVRHGLAVADFDMKKEIMYYRFHEYIPSQTND